MTAQRGKDLLLKIGDGGAPEVFTTIAGLRTRTLSLNAQAVDITHSDSVGGWRELLAGAGVRQASVSGAGVFLNDTAATAVRTAFFNAVIQNWQIVIPGFGTIEGPFLVANLDYAGDHAGEATVSLSLDSAGALSFTAAP
ncbi:MAG TPA: phage major tail protein, TP901-1 family [Parvularculaceae bacterium]|nr:phage major tail protein, TP901-1 family [Parvularculaceae bacterium]